MRDIDTIARGGTGTGDNLNDKMKDFIKEIKVLALLPIFPVSVFHTQGYPEHTS